MNAAKTKTRKPFDASEAFACIACYVLIPICVALAFWGVCGVVP